MEPANASDRKSIRRQEKAARIAERERAEVITSIMSTMQGRRWLWDYLSSAHCFHTTHVAGDALGSAFQEGRRSLGLELLADIMRSCPDSYIQAMREANVRHLQSDPNPAPDSSDAERRSGSQPDGGDSGTSADSSAASDDPDAIYPDIPNYTSPGIDIYIDGDKTR